MVSSSLWYNEPITQDDTLCFVVMPLGPVSNPSEYQSDYIYHMILQPIVEACGLTSLRADDIYQPAQVMHQIWNSIMAARVIIADLTGENSNVFYELGMAHAHGKDVILLAQDLESVPFDLRSLQLVIYSWTPPGVDRLRVDLQNAIQSVLRRAPRSQ